MIKREIVRKTMRFDLDSYLSDKSVIENQVYEIFRRQGFVNAGSIYDPTGMCTVFFGSKDGDHISYNASDFNKIRYFNEQDLQR